MPWTAAQLVYEWLLNFMAKIIIQVAFEMQQRVVKEGACFIGTTLSKQQM
jgi:hypothetical protein